MHKLGKKKGRNEGCVKIELIYMYSHVECFFLIFFFHTKNIQCGVGMPGGRVLKRSIT